ncbi:AraC family transcriptional regulator [Cytophagaceae bacterium DM2B3-1]|uniref:AraC family transcriptional regulator n=1 Tax=Xanthocytophaga flava TaxID=3048013 RepID=A0ABT7CXP4_9BACT|nr:AraC family transcriptional regulator [Xanthocytophaga flavus]MDJ1469075.1 AraC family transcriptional regulator [Xanthocytophaga flavus]MDJ1497379.1 AraC family transcriptional regulator [Xanthocytophaga flavus]
MSDNSSLSGQSQTDQTPIRDLALFHYISDKQARRNQIFLQQNLITLLEQGEKVVHYANNATIITDSQFAILSSGNCLMTEKRPVDKSYRSTMLFFDNTVLTKFFLKYASSIEKISSKPSQSQEPFLVFEKDEFIRNYIASLRLIQSQTSSFSDKKIELKFEELMLHLFEKYPEEMLSFHIRSQEEYSDLELRKAVEQNITSNLTLEELAFLCHTSVSTFKRRFVKLYNITPRQYFLQRKMEIATSLLLQNEHPGEVFYKVGFENHSSFSQSFKQVYGISPKQFQQQKMTFSQQTLID